MDQRPAGVDTKRYCGDREGDLIVGKKHEGAALTLVERKTKHWPLHESAFELCVKYMTERV